MKKITVEALVKTAIGQVFKEQHLFPNEMKSLTGHILDNSSLEVTKEGNINLVSGNIFGIGEENKHKELEQKHFYIFNFTPSYVRENPYGVDIQFLRTWNLRNVKSFQEIERYISTQMMPQTKFVVILDGKPLGYRVENTNPETMSFVLQEYIKIIWERPVYQVRYEQSGVSQEESFCSKKDVEEFVLKIFQKGAYDVFVYSLLEDKKQLKYKIEGIIAETGGTTSLSSKTASVIWDYTYPWGTDLEEYSWS